MIIVRLTGGLGNQLFQYAIGKALSIISNEKMLFDVSSYNSDKLRNYELGIFNLGIDFAETADVIKNQHASPFIMDRIKYKVLRKSIPYYRFPVLKEQSFDFDLNYTNFRNRNVYLDGYWQSENYFRHIKQILLTDLKLDELTLSIEMKCYKQEIENSNSSVSIHIRRGDYLSNPTTTAYHGICDLAYYDKAMSKIENHVENPIYFVFSDDKEYVKEVFAHKKNMIIIENVSKDHEELILMSMCKHNIIANSSFSWWGAWLNQHRDAIKIAPQKWFNDPLMQLQTKDILPDCWYRI
jgi:hypothetical protein